jgi:hypothetical protein
MIAHRAVPVASTSAGPTSSFRTPPALRTEIVSFDRGVARD